MAQPQRKYITELAMNMHCIRMTMCQQHGLQDPALEMYFNADTPCHLYAICQRPRLILKPNDVEINDLEISGVLRRSLQGVESSVPFSSLRRPHNSQLLYDATYPFSEFTLHDGNGRIFLKTHVGLLPQLLELPHHEAFDLEVLYIGQAYGESGERIAPDRLESHSTLQKIYAEAIRMAPEMEIWIVLFGFDDPYLFMQMDGKTKHTQTSDEEDTAHFSSALNKGVTEHQRINYAEAAMIRYFQPPYNIKFKDTFPSAGHTTYSECYDLDLGALMVELDFNPLGVRAYSRSRLPRWSHMIGFDLHDRNLRVGFFDIGEAMSPDEVLNSTDMPDEAHRVDELYRYMEQAIHRFGLDSVVLPCKWFDEADPIDKKLDSLHLPIVKSIQFADHMMNEGIDTTELPQDGLDFISQPILCRMNVIRSANISTLSRRDRYCRVEMLCRYIQGFDRWRIDQRINEMKASGHLHIETASGELDADIPQP